MNPTASDSRLLTLPSEIRCRIYEILYEILSLSPIIPDESEIKDDESTLHISLLLTCKRVRHEATPVFWRKATFGVRSSDHQEVFSGPRMLNRIEKVERFEVDNSLLHYWPPTTLAVALPNLKLFTISNIRCEYGHLEMLQIEGGGCTFRSGEPQTESAIRLFYSLIVTQCKDGRPQHIMSHCTGWQSTYSLQLIFVVRCRHIGLKVVPGPFWQRLGAPHLHDECSVKYSFQRGA